MSYRHKKLKEEDVVICECKYGVNDPETACGERCLNVLTSTECTLGYCQSGENCRNQSPNAIFSYARHGTLPHTQCFACCSQRFQKCEYAKTKLFRTEGRGWGLLADENIKAGQFIMEYCREVLSSEATKKRCLAYEAHKVKDAYIISVNVNYFIDATKKGSLARFINHSCQPNCETRKWIVLGETRVGIFAKRDISVRMELSYNYNFEWYGGAPVHCLCGAANCSLFLGAKSQGFKLAQECSHVWEEEDNRYIVDNLPLYDTTDDDESSPVISGTSGGNEYTYKVLNDSEESTLKLEQTNSKTKKMSQPKPKLKGYNHVCEEGDNRYIMDNLPLYDTTDDDESSPVISLTSGGNEHTKILNDSEGSTFKVEPTNSATKKKSQRKPKLKQLKTVNPGWKYGKRASETNKAACEQCPDVVREEMKKYVDVKKEQKRQALLQSDVTNIGDDKDEDIEEGEATE
ncbi:hypothetical protein R3W88_019045 [Solanum pinnatisectum]|uniref:SET domain protein n=1 Tax=Solanum pinnatisectum TaxID=50273 RepID=A0AAV9KI59_9SOLN|nr:hypothetical protein R3W88_019045 [Solanum pinnatisectum]